jgi:hypothetical protein
MHALEQSGAAFYKRLDILCHKSYVSENLRSVIGPFYKTQPNCISYLLLLQVVSELFSVYEVVKMHVNTTQNLFGCCYHNYILRRPLMVF